MIIAGIGIGILPVDSVGPELDSGQIWRLRIADHVLGADVFLVFPDNGALSESEQRFVDTVEEIKALYPDMT